MTTGYSTTLVSLAPYRRPRSYAAPAKRVRRYHKVNNNLGGYDSDLAGTRRARSFEFAVSVSNNYFGVLGKDLDLVVPAEKSPDIDRAIAEVSVDLGRPRQSRGLGAIPDTAAESMRPWAETYGHRERLSASIWTARDVAVGIYVGGLNGPERRRISRHRHEGIGEGPQPEHQAPLLYNLARVAHQGGFVSIRNAHLDAFLSLSNLTPEERQGRPRMRHIATVIEPALQAKAVKHSRPHSPGTGQLQRLLRPLSGGRPPRRLGQNAAAKRDFHLVAQSSAS